MSKVTFLHDDTELIHYGVKGMKWGVRKDRYESSGTRQARKNLSVTKKALKNEQRTGSTKAILKAKLEHRYAKEDLKKQKILDKLNSSDKPTKKQNALVEKYLAKGESLDDARAMAYSRERTKKLLIAAGTVAVTAAAVVGAKKLYGDRVDQLIKEGSVLQRVSNNLETDLHNTFYASANKSDTRKYIGLYGSTIQTKKLGFNTPELKTINTLSDIKVASPKTARAVFKDLYANNDMFKTSVDARPLRFKRNPKTGSPISAYNAFNRGMVSHDTANTIFFDTMAKRGYNAIKDVNDMKYSGYNAKNPLIIFNHTGKTAITNVRKLTNGETDRAKNVALVSIIAQDTTSMGAKAVGAILGSKAAFTVVKRTTDAKLITDYRKKHPASTMSNTEIIRSIERSRYG